MTGVAWISLTKNSMTITRNNLRKEEEEEGEEEEEEGGGGGGAIKKRCCKSARSLVHFLVSSTRNQPAAL